MTTETTAKRGPGRPRLPLGSIAPGAMVRASTMTKAQTKRAVHHVVRQSAAKQGLAGQFTVEMIGDEPYIVRAP